MANSVNSIAHILVVDDEKELADVLEIYLTGDGYIVHKCYTGAEAFDCMEHTEFEIGRASCRERV